MRERVKLFVFVLLVFMSCNIYSQTGSIKGKITEKATGESLIGATIAIDGTTKGTISDFDGNYELSNVKPGIYTIKFSFVSFTTQRQTNVEVKASEATEINIAMEEATTTLNEVKVVGKANRESEAMLLVEQKNASIAKESIGAQQLASKGISNAAAAAATVTGISKQEGEKSLNVRGLGDRYNTTTLNGLPIPPSNSELKNIDLELFGTDIISNIDIEKTYSPWLYGDFGGANVDIKTKKFKGSPFLKIEVKGKLNSSLLEVDKFYLQDGPTKLGFYTTEQPSVDELNNYSAYKFDNSWNPVEVNQIPNYGLSLSSGRSFNFSSGSKLNALLTLSYDNKASYYSKYIKRNVSGDNNSYIDLVGERYNFETQTTGMLNLNYSVNQKTDIYLNSVMLNSSEQKLSNLPGFLREEGSNSDSFKRRADYERNLIYINQILGTHNFDNNSQLKWGTAFNLVKNIVPDRRQNVFETYDKATNIGVFSVEASGNNYRYFHSYTDYEYAGNIEYSKGFGESVNSDDNRGKFGIGYSGRYKTRSFESNQFIHDIYVNRDLGDFVEVDVDNIDSFLNKENFINKGFAVGQIVPGGFWYNGILSVHAGFAYLEYNITNKLMTLVGLRYEHVYQEIEYHSNQGDSTNYFSKPQFLPSISFKYALTDKMNLRLSGSQTYTLPQLIEMPDIIFEGITEETRGNPFLYPSTVYNADIKWEFFPKSMELFSVTGFYKHIKDPINKFVTGSSSTQYSTANTGDWAIAYGIELDARKTLVELNNSKSSHVVFAGANVTLMDTDQELDRDKIQAETKGKLSATFNTAHDILQGASPLLINASLNHKFSWHNRKNSVSTSVVYNYKSKSLYSLGYFTLGNRTNQEQNTLDLVIKSNFDRFGFSLSIKNILNEPVNRIQENKTQDWLIESYSKGVDLSLGISYKF